MFLLGVGPPAADALAEQPKQHPVGSSAHPALLGARNQHPVGSSAHLALARPQLAVENHPTPGDKISEKKRHLGKVWPQLQGEGKGVRVN